MPRVNDFAGCSESIVFTGAGGPTGGGPTANFIAGAKGTTFPVYYNTDIQLADFTRAPNIAANYQQYKIKYFELSILPDADTFAPGVASGKPYLYYMIDKGNAINQQATNQQLKSMGAKPIAMDEKPIHIRWRPAVLLSTQISTASGTTSAQRYNISPWLNTDEISVGPPTFVPSTVCHYGLKWFVENNGTPVNYTATLTAHFQFKKPLVVLNPGAGVSE